MEWINANAGLLVFIAIVLLIALGVILTFVLIKVKVIVKNTADSSLKMEANIKKESNKNSEKVVLTIYNTNFRDVIIHGFGFQYKNQEIDFISEYTNERSLSEKPAVPARSSISFAIDPSRLEKYILESNDKSDKIDVLYNVVTDSVGNRIATKNKTVRKWLAKRHKIRIEKAKIQLHEEKVEKYKEEHKGKKPFSALLWPMLHPHLSKSNKVVERSEQIVLSDETEATTDSALEKETQSEVENEKVEEVIENEETNSTEESTTTDELVDGDEALETTEEENSN